MTIRTLCFAVLGLGLSGLAAAGDSGGRAYYEYRGDQDRRGNDYRRGSDPVVIVYQGRHGRENERRDYDRYDRGNRHQGHRDNRANSWRDGYRDGYRNGRGNDYRQGNTYYVVPQQQYYYRPEPIRREPSIGLHFNFR
ncbi:MAG: hypothetical protein ABWY06_07570 [Pseudomonas sp.]|uniref:hypothetical protein n=1 Tax=Pseudomonas sp. TaxID=306 RepID=UPI00339111D1